MELEKSKKNEIIDKFLLKYFEKGPDLGEIKKEKITIFLKDEEKTKIELDKTLNNILELVKFLERNYLAYYQDNFVDDNFSIDEITGIINRDKDYNKYKIGNIEELYDIIRIMEEGMYQDAFFESDEELEKLFNIVLDESVFINIIFTIVRGIIEELEKEFEAQESLLESLKDISITEKEEAAKTIQRFTKNKLDKKKSAVEKIQKAFRQNLNVITNNIPLGALLCNDLTKKEEYRRRILEMTGNTGILTKLSLYYCKFGSKILGRDVSAKKESDKICIEKFKNCTFLNNSFKSTNLIKIIFEDCNFFGGYESSHIIKRVLDKNPKYRNIHHTDRSSREISFETAKLQDSTFLKCKFFNNFKLNEIHVANTVFAKCNFYSKPTKTTIDFSQFRKSKSGATKQIFLDLYDLGSTTSTPMVNNKPTDYRNIKQEGELLFTDSEFNNVILNFFTTTRLNQVARASMLSITIPCIIFNKCDFIDTDFTGLLCCIEFRECGFVNCNFDHVHMVYVSFKNCIFGNCNFISSRLSSHKGLTMFIECKFENHQFIKSIFKNYIIHDAFVSNTLRFIDCHFNSSLFFACILINFKFNYYGDDKNMLNLRKSRFVSNRLYGTEFDYCDLEGASFAATVRDTEKINSLGSALIVLDKGPLSLTDFILEDPDKHHKDISKFLDDNKNRLFDTQLASLLVLENTDFLDMNINRFHYMNSAYVKDKLGKKFERFLFQGENNWYWIIPATSFKNASIRSCNFQQLEGFEDFDFTQVKKTSDGKPDLNATNFTACDLTNANLEGANLIGSVFQVAIITRTNFKDTVVNDNTDFENANFEEAINTDHINIGNLRQGANETHARAQLIIDNYDKLYEFFIDPENMKDNVIPDSSIKRLLSRFILDSKSGNPLNWQDKELIKRFFTAVLPNAICYKLKSTTRDSDGFCKKVIDNFTVCVSEDFINLVIQKHVSSAGNWSWLEITYASILFLLSQTELYVYTFVQFYFTEVFNAHGQGSRSCPKGMIERLITIHSQTAEYYNATIGDLVPERTDLILSVANYDTDRIDNQDHAITPEYVSNFSDKEKYKFNKLINLTKPASDLPENQEQDLGFTIGYDLSPENRAEAHRLLGKYCKFKEIIEKYGEVNNLRKLSIIYCIVLHLVILKNHSYKGVPINPTKLPEELKKNHIFIKMVANMDEHIQKNEVPPFRESVIYLYGTEESDITKEEIEDYLLPQQGGLKPLLSKTKAKTRSNSRSISKLKSKSRSRSKSSSKSRDNELIIVHVDKITPELVYNKYVETEKKMVDNYLKMDWDKILSKLKIDKLEELEIVYSKDIKKPKAKSYSIKKSKSSKRSRLTGSIKSVRAKSLPIIPKINKSKDYIMFYDLIPEIKLNKKVNPVNNIMYKVYNKQIIKKFNSIKLFNSFNSYEPKKENLNKIIVLNKTKSISKKSKSKNKSKKVYIQNY